MSQIWFTSDTHFDHGMVANLRGFTSTADHDQAIIWAWNKRVGPNDIVYHLGDVGMGSLSRYIGAIGQLNGIIHLITGNHDSLHPGISKVSGDRTYQALDVFATISQFATCKHRGIEFILSHFPYDGEGDRDMADRHVQWRLRDLGSPLIHGHTHDANQRLSLSQHGSVMIHVGWDAWRRPVSLGDVYDLYRKHHQLADQTPANG